MHSPVVEWTDHPAGSRIITVHTGDGGCGFVQTYAALLTATNGVIRAWTFGTWKARSPIEQTLLFGGGS